MTDYELVVAALNSRAAASVTIIVTKLFHEFLREAGRDSEAEIIHAALEIMRTEREGLEWYLAE